MYIVSAESALKAAKAAERRWAKGKPLSRLDGVPVTVKENIGTAGDPAPIGVPIADMTPRAEDTPVPARLREAGCVILGKTTMPDYGMMSSGLSSLHGVTRNPGTSRRTPPARRPARARRRLPATARSTSAPISAARSACPPPIAACSG